MLPLLQKKIPPHKQEVIVDINVGDFNFSFNNKKINHHKSPSQLKRNFERQKAYEKKFERTESIEEAEKYHKDEVKSEAVEEINEQKADPVEESEKYSEDNAKTETFEEKIKVNHQETQTFCNSEDVETQSEDHHELNLVKEELKISKNGDITVDETETIIELKFSHSMDNWSQVNHHIKEVLKMKMKARAWLANSGPHFKIIAFVMDKTDYELWKIETLNWENISKSTRASRLYR